LGKYLDFFLEKGKKVENKALTNPDAGVRMIKVNDKAIDNYIENYNFF